MIELDKERLHDDGAYREELRHLCITDHFFLAEVLGFNKFDRVLHKPAVELYFPKNPKLSIEDQHPVKNRMHLDPRYTFKTTLGRVDDVQWMLAFPEEITLLNQSATQELAREISMSEAFFFWKIPYEEPSTLQILFDDLIVQKQPFPNNESKWNIPGHKRGGLDSTLAYTSPLSVQSGWHPKVCSSDDMAETRNSGIHAQPEARLKVIYAYRTNINTLMPGGYNNIRGTRYHPFELYGDILEKMDPEQWKLLIRSSVTVKDGSRLMPGEFPAEEDLILNFPGLPGLDYRSLRAKFNDSYESFMCQQQNDPAGGAVQTFDEPLWNSIQMAPERLPMMGETFCCWRFPYSGKDYMSNAEGVAARLWDGKVHILDAWKGEYTPSKLAERVVKECKVHQTNLVITEDMPGTHYMEAHIRNEAMRKNYGVKIQWVDFEEDDTQRTERIRQMEPQCRAGKVWISAAAGRLTEIRKQFVNFGLIKENGIMDCISRMARRIPMSLFRAEIEAEEAEWQIRRRNNTLVDFIYGGQDQQGGLDELEDRRRREIEAHEAAMEDINTNGLTDIMGGLDG